MSMPTFHDRMTTLVELAAKQPQNLLVQVKKTTYGVLKTRSGSVLLLYSALGYASQSEMELAASNSKFKLTNGQNFDAIGVKFESYGSNHGRPFLLLAGSSGGDHKLLSVKAQLSEIDRLYSENLDESKGKFRHFVFS